MKYCNSGPLLVLVHSGIAKVMMPNIIGDEVCRVASPRLAMPNTIDIGGASLLSARLFSNSNQKRLAPTNMMADFLNES